MKLVAEPPPTLQPLGYATKFVADPPPTLQPVYLFGKVISPVVRLMSTWKVAPPPVPASVPPPADGEPHPRHWKATTASRSAWIARARAVGRRTRERERERKRKGGGTMLRCSFARQPGAHQACAVVLRATGAAPRAPPRTTGCFSPAGRASIPLPGSACGRPARARRFSRSSLTRRRDGRRHRCATGSGGQLQIRQQDDRNVHPIFVVSQPEQQLVGLLLADQDPVGPHEGEELGRLRGIGQRLDPRARLDVGARHRLPDVRPLVDQQDDLGAHRSLLLGPSCTRDASPTSNSSRPYPRYAPPFTCRDWPVM